jgi:sugar lactone lactonase YvrE
LFTTRSVGICSPEKKLVVPESMCGRPLGLQFHHASGDLYVADEYLGLLRAPARGGLAEVVTTETAGVPFNFLNGLDVDQRTGDVYFTDSSSTYRQQQHVPDRINRSCLYILHSVHASCS